MSEKETDEQLIKDPESATAGKTELDAPEESSPAVDPPSNSGGN
jgi:hypothetical protein